MRVKYTVSLVAITRVGQGFLKEPNFRNLYISDTYKKEWYIFIIMRQDNLANRVTVYGMHIQGKVLGRDSNSSPLHYLCIGAGTHPAQTNFP